MKAIIVMAMLMIGLNANAAENKTAAKISQKYLELADVFAQAHVQEGPCGAEVEAYTQDIAKLTKKAKEYHQWSEVARPFEATPAIKEVLATTMAYSVMVKDVERGNADSYAKALVGVEMHGPAPGVYGNMTRIKFKANGEIEYSWLELLNEEPYYKWHNEKGSYSLRIGSTREDWKKAIVEIKAPSHSGEYLIQPYQHKGFYGDEEWSLIPLKDREASPYMKGFVDFPSECEA